jgi:Tfp pilus assembly protein PilO
MKNLTPIILILLSIGIFFFLIDPKYKEVQALQAEVVENNKTLDIAKKLSSSREVLRSKFNKISQEEKSELEKLLPDTVDNVRLIIDINNIAEQFGIVIRDISINSTEENGTQVSTPRTQGSSFEGVIEENSIQYVDKSKIGVISFSFSVSAKYEVFLEFLKQLEESLRIVDIRNIEISRTADEGVFYDYKVTLDTYWLK